MLKWIKKIVLLFVISSLIIIFSFFILITHWSFRPNSGTINPALEMTIFSASHDNRHNSNTDLIFHEGYFYLVYQSSSLHFFSNNSKLLVNRSIDCIKWERIKEFSYKNFELRDPKLVVIGDSIFLYALKNKNFDPEPFQTVVLSSRDGINWTEISEIGPKGFLFWKPKSLDGKIWYNTAYWFEHGKSILMKSPDGRNWVIISEIHNGDTNDETAMEILSDGKIIIMARLESEPAWHSGSDFASTLVAYSYPPYKNWSKKRFFDYRVDGPALNKINDKVFAVGRLDPEGRSRFFGLASIFAKKRTAIYTVDNNNIKVVSELPSCGDTSYPGIAEKNGYIYISYYTSNSEKDYPWILGMFLPTEIKIVKIKSANLYSVL